jgi:hypothetical protein
VFEAEKYWGKGAGSVFSEKTDGLAGAIEGYGALAKNNTFLFEPPPRFLPAAMA